MGDASWAARWVMSAATLGTPPAGVKRVPSRLARAASVTARIGLLLTVLGAVSLVLSGAGSRWDWWDFRTGCAIFRWTLYGGLGAVVVSLAGLVLALVGRAHNTALLSIGTLVLLAAIAVVPVSHLRNAGQVPPIHDISTDLDDPPRFVAVLPLRQGAPNTVEYGGPPPPAPPPPGPPPPPPPPLPPPLPPPRRGVEGGGGARPALPRRGDGPPGRDPAPPRLLAFAPPDNEHPPRHFVVEKEREHQPRLVAEELEELIAEARVGRHVVAH